MSQSCQSVPPLNLDEEYYDADDLNQEMSLRGIGIGVARFSDITIGKKHALKKYDQFALNTSCFLGICVNSRNFWYKKIE